MQPQRSSTPMGDPSIMRYRGKFRSAPTPRSAQNTRTVTIKQVQEACSSNKQQGRFVLTNSLLYTVRICGRIIAIDQQEAHTNFKISDGTGTLSARIWSQNRRGCTDLSGSTVEAYYEVIANVVMDKDEILLQTLKAEQVKDHNKITLHFLQAIHEELTLGQLTNEQIDRWENAHKEATHIAKTSISRELDKEAVVTFLSSPHIRSSTNGATATDIFKELQLDDIDGRQTLTEMLDEGSVYNTIDYDHFKLADDN